MGTHAVTRAMDRQIERLKNIHIKDTGSSVFTFKMLRLY